MLNSEVKGSLFFAIGAAMEGSWRSTQLMKGEIPRRGKTAVNLPVRPLRFAGAEVALKSVQFASVNQSVESGFFAPGSWLPEGG